MHAPDRRPSDERGRFGPADQSDRKYSRLSWPFLFHRQALAEIRWFSFKATLDGMTEDSRFRRYAFAESAIVTRAAPIMIASLMTSLPAPLKYGNPCWASPRG